jgi:acyl-CoA thioester hydrolase/thioesterase-3
MNAISSSADSGPLGLKLGRTRFESELQVRPDDLDMYAHVHGSRYIDYVLAARLDQMERCYGMGMAKFAELGLAWFIRTAHLDYKRPLLMGEWFIVRTWIEEMYTAGVRVGFELLKREKRKLACDGWFHYTLVSAKTGRAVPIPEDIARRYAV